MGGENISAEERSRSSSGAAPTPIINKATFIGLSSVVLKLLSGGLHPPPSVFLGCPPRFTNVIKNIVLQSLCQERVIRQQARLISSNYLPTKWLHSQNAPATTGKTDGIFCEGVVIFQHRLCPANSLLQI